MQTKPQAAPAAAPAWFYEYLDHIAISELKARSPLQGGTRLRYDVARRVQGKQPLSQLAAEHLLPALKPGGVMFLTTGAGNPVWLPNGETDGPSGIAALGWLCTRLDMRLCVLSEKHFLPAIMAAFQAIGVPLLEEPNWKQRSIGALALEFPLGPQAGDSFAEALLARFPEATCAVFLEKPGPNAEGVFHNSSGKQKPSADVAHLNLLADKARRAGLVTGGVGDGGNEIGFGAAREELSRVHPYGKDCGCPCGRGIIDATQVDFLFPVSVSNWGGYAIAAALAIAMKRPDLMADADAVRASIGAPLAHGAFDGYTGLATPSADGVSLEANLAIYQLMLETVRLAAK